MSASKLSLGQAIDQIIAALESLDESARKTAVDAACTHLKLSITHETAAPLAPGPQSATAPKLSDIPVVSQQSPLVDIRSLKEQKQPKSAREMACIVAFYLQEVAPEPERKETISTADLEKYFKQAQFKLPSDIGQILKDAKASGYFDSPARGSYKLNAVGYNLVVHKLPNGQASS